MGALVAHMICETGKSVRWLAPFFFLFVSLSLLVWRLFVGRMDM